MNAAIPMETNLIRGAVTGDAATGNGTASTAARLLTSDAQVTLAINR
jgi:hypothetical protein